MRGKWCRINVQNFASISSAVHEISALLQWHRRRFSPLLSQWIHRNWYQWKAHIWYSISPPLSLYILTFPISNYLLVENLIFSLFLPTPLSFEAPTRSISLGPVVWKYVFKKLVLDTWGGNRILLQLLVFLSQYQRVTDRRTDRHATL